MDSIRMYISVPLAGFRVAQAREFWETYPCPPPSTVYGMLLSLVGEENRLVYRGAEIALALLSEPQRSVVLRTLWRVRDKKTPPGLGGNKRPDFQELLTDIRLSVWVRHGKNQEPEKGLVHHLRAALEQPEAISRFGGLSLGESTHLVDEVRGWREGDSDHGRMLIYHERGDLSLPVWPDHVGSRGTSWGQFILDEKKLLAGNPPEEAWVAILPTDQ